MFRTSLIAVAMALAAPACAQSVRVISGGGIEHVYGPGGTLLDDDSLRARNERAENELRVKRTEREMAARQAEADAEYNRRNALADLAAAADYEQMQLSGSTGFALPGPSRVGRSPTRPRTHTRIGPNQPIHR